MRVHSAAGQTRRPDTKTIGSTVKLLRRRLGEELVLERLTARSGVPVAPRERALCRWQVRPILWRTFAPPRPACLLGATETVRQTPR